MAKPELRNFKIVDTRTGKIAAWARWHFPYSFSDEEQAERAQEKLENERKKQQGSFSEWPEGSNLEVCEKKFGFLSRMRSELVDFENAYGSFPPIPNRFCQEKLEKLLTRE